jgi:4-alpha-glucanotransferase
MKTDTKALGARRASGILLHVSSLPSRYGIGDLGPGALNFADFLEHSAQSYWQILPLNPTSSFTGGSPYSSYSVFAGNPLFISPDLLFADGLARREELEALERPQDGRVEHRRIEETRGEFLSAVFERWAAKPDDLPGYGEFVSRHDPLWLDGFALYSALKKRFGGVSWTDWPPEYRDRRREALESFRHEAARDLERVKFTQFLFHDQLARLKDSLAQRGIGLIGDVPIYPTHDSADVWENQEIFKLDPQTGAQKVVAGVPPDYFSETGQLWGNPVYDWEALEARGFDWWIRRFETRLEHLDVLRLDHFRGFAACWEVSPDEKTALNGRWSEVPGRRFFEAVRHRFPEMPFIAEDLGYITPDVLELRDDFGLPGMRVLMFSFGDDAPESTNSLHNHVRNSVAFSGTHDNNTARGWFAQEATPREKKRLNVYTGKIVDEGNVAREFARLTLMSVADTALLPLQDVLGLPASARLNTPATIEGNWSWRLESGQLDLEAAESLAEMTTLFGRAPADGSK